LSSRLAAAAASATAAASSKLTRTPCMNIARLASMAPKTATAKAPPAWRLVLNTPPTTPERCPGTLLTRAAVTGGITKGPASPTGDHHRGQHPGGRRRGEADDDQARHHHDQAAGDEHPGAQPFGDGRAERGERRTYHHHRQKYNASGQRRQAPQLLQVQAHHKRQPVVADHEREPGRHRDRNVAVFAGSAQPVNLARFIFFDPRSSEFYRDWDGIAAAAVGSLRTEAGRDPYDRALTNLVGELSTRSEEFRGRWAAHDVEYYRSGVQPFRHPIAGDLILDYDALEIPADPGLTIIAYTAEPGSPARQALDLLADWATTPANAPTAQAGRTDPAAETRRPSSSDS
jgi:hypothetical protein